MEMGHSENFVLAMGAGGLTPLTLCHLIINILLHDPYLYVYTLTQVVITLILN
jgi:hypothetical protein